MNVTDEIKQKIDIVDVVSQYVKLQKSGRNYKANCPFHSEKTPSFFVFPERQSWHCFGACASGGDVFTFVMKKEGVDFSQALRTLAEKANITLTFKSEKTTKEEEERQQRLYKINEVAAEYFHYLLLHSEEAGTAREYVNKRGLTSKTVEDFQLGYAPDKWDALSSHLIKAGYREDEIIALGLVVVKDKGGYYDRFRNRLIFPIKDIKSRVVGFGGRALDDTMPKYLNSSQTLLFDKSSILYAIDRAQNAIRQQDSIVITEGYMDTITAHQYGFENTVASMGTSLTEKQITALRKLSKNIIVALDADAAGLEAIRRSVLPIEGQIPTEHWQPWAGSKTYDELVKYEIQVVEIKGGKDPDEIISKSPGQWEKLLKESQPIIDFTLKKEIDNINQDSPRDKSDFVSKFLPIIAHIKDPVRRAHYVQKLAGLLKMDERFISEALFNLLNQEKKYKSAKGSKVVKTYSEGDTSSRRIEEYCLALVLQFPDLNNYMAGLASEYFEHSENRDILLKWQDNPDIDSISKNIDPAMQGYLDHLLSLGSQLPGSLGESQSERRLAINDCINRLQERYIKNLEIKKKLILAEEKGNTDNELAKLIEHGISESAQLKDIFKKRRGFFSRTKGS